MPNPISARSKHIATLTGRPPQPRGNGGRAQHIATLTGVPPQQQINARAKAAAVGRNPALAHLGKNRAIPNKILGAKELVGQVLETADGRKFRITGLDVLLPETADTYAMQKRYGTVADATAVARRLPPLPPAPAVPHPLPWEQPPGPPTAVIRPTAPRPYRPAPFDPRTLGKPFETTERHWNGMADLMEGHGLTYASKSKLHNAFYRGTQRVNRLAGHKLVPPSHVASQTARMARAVTNSRLARFGSKAGGKIAGVGAGLAAAKIIYEKETNTYNAHTFVDGGMLLVTVAGIGLTILAGGTAPVWVPIAGVVIMIYGVADYLFDVGGSIDDAVGRDSQFKGAWEKLNMGR